VAFIRAIDVSVDIPVYDVAGGSIRKFLLHNAVGGQLAQQGSHLVVRALSDINIDARDGDRIGLIGRNGSGKTTLLRVLSGAYPPSAGRIDIGGRVSPMLDTTLGMERDATGYENIRICGTLRGMTRQQIENNLDDIAAFTELGSYLGMPVRSYSSGMQLRLAFAIATVQEAEILLIDEAIAAGDEHFLAKAQERLHKLVRKSRILLVASHSAAVIRELCNKALWLNGGTVMGFGEVDRVLGAYHKEDPMLAFDPTSALSSL
jgi:ABC-type polysaccharide/polyol phosphate transport system ATPase subunit